MWPQQQPGPGQMFMPQPQQHAPRPMTAMPQQAAPALQQSAQTSRVRKPIVISNRNTGEEVSTARKDPPPPAAASGADKQTDSAAAQTVRIRSGAALAAGWRSVERLGASREGWAQLDSGNL